MSRTCCASASIRAGRAPARGRAAGQRLQAGDALGWVDEATTLVLRGVDPDPADILLFTLPR